MTENEESLLWVFGTAGAATALYFALRPAKALPGETVAAPLAPVSPPSAYADLAAVDARFGQVRELYRMGYLTPFQAIDQLTSLTSAAAALETAGKAGESETMALLAQIEEFARGVERFVAEQRAAQASVPEA
jgi:hypothetical protein